MFLVYLPAKVENKQQLRQSRGVLGGSLESVRGMPKCAENPAQASIGKEEAILQVLLVGTHYAF